VQVEAGKVEGGRAGIKCVVWDLDNTLWQGRLLEGDRLGLTPGILGIVKELDNRGILQSIASKNEFSDAWRKLEELGLTEYFLCPQIGWGEKSRSLSEIANQLGIALGSIAFVDDDAYEREEVGWHHPSVLLIDAADIGKLLDMGEMQPRYVTSESKLRRSLYQSDMRRKLAEVEFKGDKEAFLISLKEVVRIRPAEVLDLWRAEELTVRTNQLNTTGRCYSYDDIKMMMTSSNHLVLVADFEDRFGSGGTVGLALIETTACYWVLKLLIVSCRVLTRGVGGILLSHILTRARRNGVKLRAEFVDTGRNRLMYVTYKMHGFQEIAAQASDILLEHDLTSIRAYPSHVVVAETP